MKHLRIAALAGISILALGHAAFAQTYSQAPELDALVSSGDLPAVAERVGAEPRVIVPVGEVGRYGGTFRGGNDRNMLFTHLGHEPLIAWDADWIGEVVPNIAACYTASADSKDFTFTLREG
ncbi:hypothetical protein [Devosia sp.]|uniref:hypothetical protein n=1 Tax=Devosia sp. TaxID=1871048 RepID=UPI002FC7F078